MRVLQETYVGSGSLDWDNDYRFKDKNDAEYRLNVIPVGLGSHFVLTNLKGTTRYEHSFDYPSGYEAQTLTCVGDCYHEEIDAVYFFIYGSDGGDSIIRFNFSDNSFDKIAFCHTGLGLDPDYPITDAFFIGDWLHFNPRTSSPRAINVQWAYWDWAAYTRSYTANANTWSVGDYVKDRNRVFLINDNTITRASSLFGDSDGATFVDYTYMDVDTLPGSGTVNAYKRTRNYYNMPEILPHTPTVEISTDDTKEYNNIRGRIFQFCYRLYVPDQGYTVASSFTDIISTPEAETNKGEVVGDISESNTIRVSFPISQSTTPAAWLDWDMLFEFAEILFREGPSDDWKVAERMDQQSINYSTETGGVYAYIDFYNDRAYDVADNVSIEKQYNALPRLANAQWSLDGERSAYGGVVEGYDLNMNVDVSLTTGERELTLDTTAGAVDSGAADGGTHGWTVAWDTDYNKWKWELTTAISNPPSGDGAAAGETLKVVISGITYTHLLDANDVGSANAYLDEIVAMLARGGVSAGYTGGKAYFYSDIMGGYVSSVQRWTSSATTTVAQKYSSFKNGTWHPFCLFYYDDALRRSEPVFSSAMRVYMENLPEVLTQADSTNYQRYIDWTISHLPPQWARYWRWGYAGNQTIDKFWQYNIAELTSETKPVGTDTWTKIDISPLQRINDENYTAGDHYFPNTAIDAYSWEPGDRLRFITDHIDPPSNYDELSLMTESFDYEIKEFDDVNHYIYIDDITSPATTTTSTTSPPGFEDRTMIVEIYRPKKQTGTTVYYEYGPLYKTYASSGTYYHRGDTVDQSSGVAAEGQFNRGDVWVLTRLSSLSPFATADAAFYVESYSWSDFSVTEGWGKGKAGVFTGIGEKYLNNVRYSNRYSPNTNTSGLSTFDFLDYKGLNTAHGNIVSMRQTGNTLKVIFERNTASVLVNKTQFFNSDGTSQVVKSDEVLGDVVYSNYHFGTIFPESVFLMDRTVYFFDIHRRAYVRFSSNGIEAISDYKMKRYFNEKAVAIEASGTGNVQVWTTYDYEYDLLYVHFVDSVTPSNDEVILFHEPQNRWVSFVQISDTIQSAGTTTTTSTSSSSSTSSTSTHSYDSGLVFSKGSMVLVSYYGDSIYVHNGNSTRNYLWGSQRESIVEVIANENPNVKKTFEAIAIHSNKPWDINYINVPTDSTYTSGMQSKIPESRFKLREGIYTSDYLRNMKTYSSTASNLDLVRGEQLRGYYALHRLVNDDTTEVKLYKVDVYGNISLI